MYLVKKTFTFISAASIVVISLACQQKQIDPVENPKGVVEQMVAAIGGIDKLHSLKDVEYTYIYHDLTNDKKDISLEKYVFDGELSWAHYETREKNVMPQMEGEINQGFNGSESWMTIDGKLVDDNPQLAKLCDFLRKTNYYWFTMMFKLMDPGVQYKYSGTRTVDRVDYNLINISFGEEVGDVQDTYLLYINPETKLVDQFLFTVMDFGVAEPFLMKVEYEEIQGVKLPAKRKYVRANWDGEPQNDEWTAATWTNIKFNNGFDRSMFNKPTFQ